MKPFRTPAALVAAELVPPERLAALEQVAARYAVSLTPDVIDLIHSDDPFDPIALALRADRDARAPR